MFVVQHDDGVGRYMGSARNSGRAACNRRVLCSWRV